MLGTFTRATFPMCTCDSGLQKVAVPNDFLRNSDSRAMILLRVPTEPLRNTQKCVYFLCESNMLCDIITISHLADGDPRQLYAENKAFLWSSHLPPDPECPRGPPRAPEGPRRHPRAPAGSRWPPEASESTRRLPRAPEGSREPRELPRAPEGPREHPMASESP